MADVQHFAGKVTPTPASTAGCGMVLKPGVEPTTPEIGGFWFDDALNALAYFEKGGTGIYLPNANGNAGEALVSNGDTLPTYQYLGRLLTGAPDPTTEGVNGDFYIATVSNKIFGPKAAGVWPVGVSIVGPQGVPGAAGAGIIASGRQGIYNSDVSAETQINSGFANVGAGVLNALGRKLILKGSGFFTTNLAETPTLTISGKFGGVTFASITTGALTASVAEGRFDFDLEFTVVTTGATGNVVGRGVLNIDLAGTNVYTTYKVGSVASAAIDFTGVAGIQAMVASSANVKSVTTDECSVQAF